MAGRPGPDDAGHGDTGLGEQVLARRFVRRRGGGDPRGVDVVDAVVEAVTRRALKGEVAAAREVLRLARANQAAAALRPPPPPRFRSGSSATIMERVLIDLGAMTQAPDSEDEPGEPSTGRLRLERWVLDAALARDPALEARLKASWRWDQAERACGEAW